MDKLASEVHLTRQIRSTKQQEKAAVSSQESSSITKTIKNKMTGLLGSVKSFLGSSESKDKVDNKDTKTDSSRRQDSFSDWLSLPFLYNSPSQIVQTYHLPVNTYHTSLNSLNSMNLNNRAIPLQVNRIPMNSKNLSPQMLATSANVQSFTKLSPPPVLMQEFRLNQNHNQNNGQNNKNLQKMVNAHTMHHSIQMNKPGNFMEKEKFSVLIPHSSESIPKINNKPINSNLNILKTEYKLSNSKSKNLKNNYKEKKIQRRPDRPDIQLGELVKHELNKFRLNSKPSNQFNDNHHQSTLNGNNNVKDDKFKKNSNLHSTNINHYQASNSAMKPNVVHYHFEPLSNVNDLHNLNDQHLHYHHHQQHIPPPNSMQPQSNAIIDNYIQLNHHLKDEHIHIPFASNQQSNSISINNKQMNKHQNNHQQNYDSLLSSDLFKDYSIDIRPIHLKSHDKLKPLANSRQQQPKSANKQNKNNNGFIPMKQTSSTNKKNNLLQPSASNVERKHQNTITSNSNSNTNSNQIQSNINQTSRSKNNRIISDELLFIDDKQKLANQKNSNLLIIPVPDEYPKSQSLEEIQRLVNFYPEFFPDNFNLNSKLSQVNGSLEQLLAQKNPNTDYFVVTVDDKNQHNTSKPIIRLEEYLKYETPVDEKKNQSNKIKKVNNKSGQQTSRKSNKKKQSNQVKPVNIPEIPSTPVINTATSKAPVVIKLEIPHGRPEIVERIFDKVKDDLIHTTSSLGPDRPVYISVTSSTTPQQTSFSTNKQTTPSISTSTESILNSSIKDSSAESDELIDTSKVYLLGQNQIPQHVFESLKQVHLNF